MVGLSPNFWYKYQFPAYFTVIYAFFWAFWASLVVQLVKNLPAMWETWVQSPLERSPGKGHGNPLQYSCLGNSTERRAGQAAAMESQRFGDDSAANFRFHFHAFLWEF